jgi:lipopolysaccharide transport system ATP-binding protein
MPLAIKVENLSKAYQIGQIGTGTISRDIERWAARIRGKEDPFQRVGESTNSSKPGHSDWVWSLKDIEFEIERGETVGIIGRNGAGKSTLLKILSRVTAPTKGTVKARGRIASLLEVGTGFHPELSGRENIFLNGSILGMRKYEISRKLDEIIEFSGVERYIDTPVKRYSSGMYVRLAFAVAAHLDAEILIVDEVLAVGDAEFQKKCLGKMAEVSKGFERTVLFVSHNMAAVKSLCRKAILLVGGRAEYIGDSGITASRYMLGGAQHANHFVFGEKYSSGHFCISEIRLSAVGKQLEDPLDEYDEIKLETDIVIFQNENDLHFTYVLKSENGEPIFTSSHITYGVALHQGKNRLTCWLPKGFLNIGSYYLDAYLIKDASVTVFREFDIASFSVQEGQRPLGSWMGREPGLIKPVFEWTNNSL